MIKNKFLKIFLISLALVAIILASVIYYLVRELKSGVLPEAVVQQVVRDITQKESNTDQLVHTLLGFDQPRTLLFLLLNNTELRPGGGFIGAYAVVTVTNGKPELVKLEGTEIIDNMSSTSSLPMPPPVLAKYLKVPYWFFRDSNWSPDFASSSVFGLFLYDKEGGVKRKEIDAVIGITPTVFEKILAIVGPLNVNGIEFNSANFTEQLEYQVEKAYADQGITKVNRKDIMKDLAEAFLSKAKSEGILKISEYLGLAKQMLSEKQVVVYSPHVDLQEIIRQGGFAGEMKATSGDYLLWVDANLGALKTDSVISRNLRYIIYPSSSGFTSEATMEFTHGGTRDWKTSIYRDYVRAYVPFGSKLLGVSSLPPGGLVEPLIVDSGVENGRTWFGVYYSVYYGETKRLTFKYELPQNLLSTSSIDYQLLVQKQIGTNNVPLTLDLNFGKAITSANPPVVPNGQNISAYRAESSLNTDQSFSVNLISN